MSSSFHPENEVSGLMLSKVPSSSCDSKAFPLPLNIGEQCLHCSSISPQEALFRGRGLNSPQLSLPLEWFFTVFKRVLEEQPFLKLCLKIYSIFSKLVEEKGKCKEGNSIVNTTCFS